MKRVQFHKLDSGQWGLGVYLFLDTTDDAGNEPTYDECHELWIVFVAWALILRWPL